MTPEEKARQTIDGLLLASGWTVQNRVDANIDAAPGVAIREFALGHGYGEAVRTFRDRLFTDIFPGRTEVPKTLIFAKDDSHADDIVKILREEFGKGNDFAQKITYRAGAAKVRVTKKDKDGNEYEAGEWVSSGLKPEHLLSEFRTAYYPRIAVTVDMIATGTDIKPLEIVMFLRAVKSRTMFEQMKGRGARTVTATELRSVTPDGASKDHFVIIDAVGLEPEKMQDVQPLEKKRNVSLDKLFELVTFGNREPDILSSIASRLSRLDLQLTPNDRTALNEAAQGKPISAIASEIVAALDPDRHVDAARAANNTSEPTDEQIALARKSCSNHAYFTYFACTVRRVALRGSRAAFHHCPGRCTAVHGATTQAVRTDARTRNHLGA